MVSQKEEQMYEEISKWLYEYNATDNLGVKKNIKALICSRMLPIIKRIAHTIARRSYDPIEDLIQAGSIGLLKAIESYTKDINDNFKIYSGYLIIGEMKHYLRDKLNTIRVPRHIQELTYRINTFTSTLTVEELNSLTNENVADALKVSPKEVDFALQADRRKSTVSLEEIFAADSDNLSFEEVLTKEDYKESREVEDIKIILKDIIKKLPDEYRTLVELYYYNDLS